MKELTLEQLKSKAIEFALEIAPPPSNNYELIRDSYLAGALQTQLALSQKFFQDNQPVSSYEIWHDSIFSKDLDRFNRLHDWIVNRFKGNQTELVLDLMKLTDRPENNRGTLRAILSTIQPFLPVWPEVQSEYKRLLYRLGSE
jgi:hypothetical protein